MLWVISLQIVAAHNRPIGGTTPSIAHHQHIWGLRIPASTLRHRKTIHLPSVQKIVSYRLLFVIEINILGADFILRSLLVNVELKKKILSNIKGPHMKFLPYCRKWDEPSTKMPSLGINIRVQIFRRVGSWSMNIMALLPGLYYITYVQILHLDLI